MTRVPSNVDHNPNAGVLAIDVLQKPAYGAYGPATTPNAPGASGLPNMTTTSVPYSSPYSGNTTVSSAGYRPGTTGRTTNYNFSTAAPAVNSSQPSNTGLNFPSASLPVQGNPAYPTGQLQAFPQPAIGLPSNTSAPAQPALPAASIT